MSEKKPPKKSKPASTGTKPDLAKSGPMDLQLLQQIVEMMTAHDLNTVELRDGTNRVVLKRGANLIAAPAPHYAPAPTPVPPASGAATSVAVTPTAPAEDDSLVPIKSPMVGTFYVAATPEAKAFVSVGTSINEETDVCIIEAMKVFNNIKAETRGTIAKILVTNGQTVEFGQPLFLVKP